LSTFQTTDVSNIVQRVPEGFYQNNSATRALGWPEDSNSWTHLLSVTHTNPDNYYALQISGGFFDNDRFYIRKTAGAGNQPWQEIWHSGNLTLTDHQHLRRLGWQGDNSNRTLRDEFGENLSAAQARFPSAQSLDEYIDGCAIERVIQLNRIYFGRSSIYIPPGGSRISRTIDTTGTEVAIRGSGRGVTNLILYTAGGTLFKHGAGDVPFVEGVSPQNRLFQIDNLCLICEVDYPGTRALDISYNATTGWFFQTHIKNVDIRGFDQPIRIINPNRGLQMDTVGIYGKDNVGHQHPAVEIRTTERSRDHSAQACFKSVRTSGYRWGWDVTMELSSGATDKQREETRRSMEGFIFVDCGAYNGWGMVRVDQQEPKYSSLLWEFLGCDWQGCGYALDMLRCNNVTVRDGYWIANTNVPLTDANDPVDPSFRRYFRFRGCRDILLDHLRIDVSEDFPAHVLVEAEIDCENVLIKDCIVSNHATTAIAGFRIAGTGANTVREMDTVWLTWNSPEDRKVVDVFANQVSQTRARIYGTVDQTGEYAFRGKLPVNFNANGDVTVRLPRRPPVPSTNLGQETPFFLTEPVILVTALSELTALRVSATSQWEFVVSGGSAMANKQGVWIAWNASGR
jgi:hypothetical protein